MFEGLNKRKKFASITVPANPSEKHVAIKGTGRCPGCSHPIELAPMRLCRFCGYHFSLGAYERIEMIVDVDSFVEMDAGLSSLNPLAFPNYDEKLSHAREQSGLNEAIVTGSARIGGFPLIIGVMDTKFMMGSMGSVVGEKIWRAAEAAIEKQCPLFLCTASGGARMQEGMLSLAQMSKTSAAIAMVHEAGLLYLILMTHPTTGGVSASFASLADIILAEPGALIAFTGPRVIEQTIGQRLPDHFQQAEFLLEHGMIDQVVERVHLRSTLQTILKIHRMKRND